MKTKTVIQYGKRGRKPKYNLRLMKIGGERTIIVEPPDVHRKVAALHSSAKNNKVAISTEYVNGVLHYTRIK
jgi:hypothetical protein